MVVVKAVVWGVVWAVAVAGALGFVLTLVIKAGIEAASRPTGSFVDVDGGRLHVIERGAAREGPRATIVLIHGTSGNAREPLFTLGPLLPPDVQIITIDRPGHGFSDRPGGLADASPERQAALIAQTLRKLGVRRALVAAHSFGGAVALTLALDHPAEVGGLMLLAPASHPWPGGIAAYYSISANPVLGPFFTWTLAAPAASLLIDAGIASVFSPQPVPDGYMEAAGIRLLLRPANFRANAQDVAGLLAFVTTQAARYGEITVPTTLITGDTDGVVSPTIHSAALARQIAGAKLLVLPGVGHQPQVSAPEVVRREIEALVDEMAKSEGR